MSQSAPTNGITDLPTNDLNRLRDLTINDSGFAFDPQTGLTYTISMTGMDIIRWLKDGLDETQIVDRVQGDYDVDEHTAAQDVEAFVRSLKGYSLV